MTPDRTTSAAEPLHPIGPVFFRRHDIAAGSDRGMGSSLIQHGVCKRGLIARRRVSTLMDCSRFWVGAWFPMFCPSRKPLEPAAHLQGSLQAGMAGLGNCDLSDGAGTHPRLTSNSEDPLCACTGMSTS